MCPRRNRKSQSAISCYWCDRPFRPRRTGGRAQRFCRPGCRRQFHAAARRWTLDAIGAGMLSVGDIKTGFQRTRALLQASSELVGVTRSEGFIAAPLSRCRCSPVSRSRH